MYDSRVEAERSKARTHGCGQGQSDVPHFTAGPGKAGEDAWSVVVAVAAAAQAEAVPVAGACDVTVSLVHQ